MINNEFIFQSMTILLAMLGIIIPLVTTPGQKRHSAFHWGEFINRDDKKIANDLQVASILTYGLPMAYYIFIVFLSIFKGHIHSFVEIIMLIGIIICLIFHRILNRIYHKKPRKIIKLFNNNAFIKNRLKLRYLSYLFVFLLILYPFFIIKFAYDRDIFFALSILWLIFLGFNPILYFMRIAHFLMHFKLVSKIELRTYDGKVYTNISELQIVKDYYVVTYSEKSIEKKAFILSEYVHSIEKTISDQAYVERIL